MSRAVLDASAILAFLRGEPGADVVSGYRGDAIVSAVNVAEAGARLANFGASPAEVRRSVALMSVEIVPFDEEQGPTRRRIFAAPPAIGGFRSVIVRVSSWRRAEACRR